MTEIKGMHPFAEHFQMFSDEELDLLADDIRENGLMEPITITPDGLILDGRNRFEACRRAGVQPETEVYEGDSFGQFVRSRNVRRRHSTQGQLAMSTALTMVAEDPTVRKNGRWKRDSVAIHESVNSDTRTWLNHMAKAGLIIDVSERAKILGPEYELFVKQPELVKSGETTLDAAYRVAQDFETKAAMAEMAVHLPLTKASGLIEQLAIDAEKAVESIPVIDAPLRKQERKQLEETAKKYTAAAAAIRTYLKEAQ